MRVLLFNPPYTRLRNTKERTEMVPPLALAYIAASLHDAGHDVFIHDANYNPSERLVAVDDGRHLLGVFKDYEKNISSNEHPAWRECRALAAALEPQLVGITTLSPVRNSALKLAGLCKEVDPGITVALGGYHPTVCADDVLEHESVDAAVRGEGEVTFTELAARVEAGGGFDGLPGVSFRSAGAVIHNPDRELVRDIDTLPSAAPFIPGGDTGKAPIQFARGCPYRCKFCADSTLWRRKTRFHSAARMAGDIETVIEKLGIREFSFVDGTFNLNRRRVLELCDTIAARGLSIRWDALVRADRLDEELVAACRRAGCSQMNLGVESGSQYVLDKLDKKTNLDSIEADIQLIKKHRITCVSFFCVGMPPERKEDMRATRELILKLRHDYVIMNIFTPFRGTEFYDELVASGRLDESHDFDAFGYKAPTNHFTPELSKREYDELRDAIVRAVDLVNKRGKLPLKLFLYNLDFYIRHPLHLWKRIRIFLGF